MNNYFIINTTVNENAVCFVSFHSYVNPPRGCGGNGAGTALRNWGQKWTLFFRVLTATLSCIDNYPRPSPMRSKSTFPPGFENNLTVNLIQMCFVHHPSLSLTPTCKASGLLPLPTTTPPFLLAKVRALHAALHTHGCFRGPHPSRSAGRIPGFPARRCYC